jgi:hypothetical protein
MSEQQQTQQEVEHHLNRLGRIQREYATWIWLSIFLFWLVFPLVFLIWRKIQFLIELNKVNKLLKDYDLERALLFQIIGVIATTVAFFAGWIILIVSYDSMERWGRRYADEHPSQNIEKFVSAMKTVKIGLITFPLFFGLFIIPIGMARAGDALVAEFGSQVYSTQAKISQTTNIDSKVPGSQEVTRYIPKFCAACGNPVENGLKFCKNCGTPL